MKPLVDKAAAELVVPVEHVRAVPSVTDLPFDKCGMPRLQERMREARETGGFVEDENDRDAANGGVRRLAGGR